MFQYVRYYDRYQNLRGGLGGLPQWARFIVGVVALPGLVLLSLSILAFVVSLLALLLVTVPVYSFLRSATAVRRAPQPMSPGTKRVDVTVIEPH